MSLPLLSKLPARLRVLLLTLLGLVMLVTAAFLLARDTVLAAPPPEYIAARTIGNTDVNPFGANFFLEREVESWKRERTAQMAREAGIGWGRQEFIWAEIEPEQGIFNWTKYDGIVDLFARNKIQVIARLDRPPAWARSRASATGSSGPPDDFAAYGRFVREFARHYRDKITYFQIWNEPNLGREWNDAPIDPAAYTRLLQTAYENAKAIDPNIRILSAPLAITLGESFTPNSPLYRNMNDLQFLEEMYAAGAKPYFDILSSNAFGLGASPDDLPNPGKLNFQRVLLERDVMERNGDQDKAVWILEYGWNAAPDWIPDSRLVWGRVTEQQQAEYTVQGIALARQYWKWAGVVSIWFFRQVGDITPNNPESYFRMVDVDFVPRPVYFSVSAATQSLGLAGPGEYQETNPAMELDGDWVTQFNPNANAGQFASSDSDSGTATLKFNGEGLDLVMRREPGAGRLYATIDGQPLAGLARDETGQTFVEEAGGQEEWRAVVQVVRGLPRGEHTLFLRAEGKVNLDGFIVPPIDPAQPPWALIGILGVSGIGSLVLGWTQWGVET